MRATYCTIIGPTVGVKPMPRFSRDDQMALPDAYAGWAADVAQTALRNSMSLTKLIRASAR